MKLIDAKKEYKKISWDYPFKEQVKGQRDGEYRVSC
jgi:hypothetical protein